MSFDFGKKRKKKDENTAMYGYPHGIIDLTDYLDDDIMETDVLGSYTGVPVQNMDDDYYETPVQDADDL